MNVIVLSEKEERRKRKYFVEKYIDRENQSSLREKLKVV
jgi:hypothetical protein